ncbi:HelD family protein [Kitasatospora cineracea]|uniref:HelD family protein n=1 Tax=Kitasatospora cineracea TaxID=88074 RepID=UPI0036DA41EE
MDEIAADPPLAAQLGLEQQRLTELYAHLDAARAEARAALERTARAPRDGTRQARLEREAAHAERAGRLARLTAVERGLCFGRIDGGDGGSRYIGRTGLLDGEFEPLLLDWRAPAARPFYTAGPADPQGLVRRRHLRTEGRRVVGLDDEAFDLDALDAAGARATLVGEAALLAELRRAGTGRMREVVATIQGEQDRVIRSGLAGALVVHGGPGTGKTVAALHRAAYLLYTHREVLERRGVLVIGPNPAFLRHIERVLPSLGETGVLLRTVGELFPGVRATAADRPEAAVLKGSLRMADVLAGAVRLHQRLPAGDGRIAALDLPLPRRVLHAARERARGLRLPHNAARPVFLAAALEGLARVRAEELGRPWDEEEARYAPGELGAEPAVRAALDALWPLLTPHRLVEALLADPDALAPGLSPAERAALRRAPGAPWTVEDVPLLDEAAELLGSDGAAERAAEAAGERARAAAEAYAHGVLEVTGQADELDPAELAARHAEADPYRTAAERAADDREWTFGHVVVDEAQELSELAWRTVMRRIPTRSLTVVGDLAQTSSAAGARDWQQVLGRYLGTRWREERLEIGYRTPAPVMAVAAAVLADVDPAARAPVPVRTDGEPPRAVRVADYAAELPALLAPDGPGAGVTGLVVPDARLAELAHLGALSAARCKGLEFDAVVVADPAAIRAQSPRGGNDLYVALTRATRRLTVAHHGPLPEPLRAAFEQVAAGGGGEIGVSGGQRTG